MIADEAVSVNLNLYHYNKNNNKGVYYRRASESDEWVHHFLSFVIVLKRVRKRERGKSGNVRLGYYLIFLLKKKTDERMTV